MCKSFSVLRLLYMAKGNSYLKIQRSVGFLRESASKETFYLTMKDNASKILLLWLLPWIMHLLSVRGIISTYLWSPHSVSRLLGKWNSAVQAPKFCTVFYSDPTLSTCPENIIYKFMRNTSFPSEIYRDSSASRIGVNSRQPPGIHWNSWWKQNYLTAFPLDV